MVPVVIRLLPSFTKPELEGFQRMNTSRRISLALCIVAVASVPAVAQTLTLTNATVIDVTNGTLKRGSTIVIDGNRIRAVSAAQSPPTRSGQVVDLHGMYVIPGLWDMHTHAYFGWPRDFGDSYVLSLFIANGITGV